SARLWCRWRSGRAPGLSTVRPTTWLAPADFLSTRNCTCMSTQPSSRLRPSTVSTLRILVRYIGGAPGVVVCRGGVGGSLAAAITLLKGFARAKANFSDFEVMLVLPGGDRLHAQ